jgi:hypothetical protein
MTQDNLSQKQEQDKSDNREKNSIPNKPSSISPQLSPDERIKRARPENPFNEISIQ